MTGKLLLRGMLVGLFAGLLSFGFLRVFGEPSVDRAIAFEGQMEAAHAHHDHGGGHADAPAAAEPQEDLVGRPVQAGLGLFTGVMVYSAAFGGLFALAFAAVYGRVGNLGPRATSALLGAAGFVAIYLVPNLKYPANPPSVGDANTIGVRTALYFMAVLISLVGMIAAVTTRQRLAPRYGAWNAALIAGAAYLAIVVLAAIALPAVNEVPEGFPATVLWQFRVASLGAQALMWATLGLAFGAVLDYGTARGDRRLLASVP